MVACTPQTSYRSGTGWPHNSDRETERERERDRERSRQTLTRMHGASEQAESSPFMAILSIPRVFAKIPGSYLQCVVVHDMSLHSPVIFLRGVRPLGASFGRFGRAKSGSSSHAGRVLSQYIESMDENPWNPSVLICFYDLWLPDVARIIQNLSIFTTRFGNVCTEQLLTKERPSEMAEMKIEAEKKRMLWVIHSFVSMDWLKGKPSKTKNPMMLRLQIIIGFPADCLNYYRVSCRFSMCSLQPILGFSVWHSFVGPSAVATARRKLSALPRTVVPRWWVSWPFAPASVLGPFVIGYLMLFSITSIRFRMLIHIDWCGTNNNKPPIWELWWFWG